MPEFIIDKALLTDVGRKRRHNEDFVGYFEPPDPRSLASGGRLYVVADGVGGAAAGDVASEYAVGKVLHEYYRSTESGLGRRLQASIRQANADLFEYVQRNPDLGRMGTTLVAAVVHGDRLIIGNVGDSRAYLIRNGKIRQITRDHSLVAKLVEEGTITPEEAETHPRRNVILRSVGADASVQADIFDGTLQPGDQVLLCSDGLTRHLSDGEILKVVSRSKPDRAVSQLVEMANTRGGKDNISVVLLRIGEAVPLQTLVKRMARRRELVEPKFDELQDTAHRTPESLPARRRRPTWMWLAAGIVVVLLALVCIWVVKQGWGRATPGDGDETAAPGPAAPFVSPLGTDATIPAQTETATVPTLAGTATGTPAATDTPTPAGLSLHDTSTRAKDGMVMVYVPAGEFEMGSTEDDIGRVLELCREYGQSCMRDEFENELSAHTVTLDGFWIDRTEVTNAQFRRCVDAGACEIPVACQGEHNFNEASKAEYPVVCVDWQDAVDCCSWTGGRLPTEAEWEYAARGSEGRVYPWGDAAPTCGLAQYGECSGDTAVVGSHPEGASWCGAMDMAGNVWEWVADWHGEYPLDRQENPVGPQSGEYRVLRGGSGAAGSQYLHAANRRYEPPDEQSGTIGFRCAMDEP